LYKVRTIKKTNLTTAENTGAHRQEINRVIFEIQKAQRSLQINWKQTRSLRTLWGLLVIFLLCWMFAGASSVPWQQMQFPQENGLLSSQTLSVLILPAIIAGLTALILFYFFLSFLSETYRHFLNSHILKLDGFHLELQSRYSLLMFWKRVTKTIPLPTNISLFTVWENELPLSWNGFGYTEYQIQYKTFDNETLDLPIQFEDEPQAQFLAAQLNVHFQLENGSEI